jgi:hypothetical protein
MLRVEARRGLACTCALRKATILALVVGGCSTARAPGSPDSGAGDPDAAPPADARAAADAAPPAPDAAPPGPWRHTITVDGASSFTGDEVFATTTASYSAYASWDDDTLYLGYLGGDVAAGDPKKWLLVYLDALPGGAATGHRYNTETPAFPSGFRADYYYRWQSSGGIEDVMEWTGDGWRTSATIAPGSARAGAFIEIGLPLADLGDPQELGVVLLWINESDGLEAAYGGLYADSFIDGYHASIPIARYLSIDRASSLPPNDDRNRRP